MNQNGYSILLSNNIECSNDLKSVILIVQKFNVTVLFATKNDNV